ncbi:MAG TPA: ABC transporter permease [Solirubrobacteraceae bacterium]|nr:ABC transporter permease [Solirubrobacteraceae bacterium]
MNLGLLRYRYLFEQMVRRELRQKYKGSALGVLWYLVNPLILTGAYTLMFGLVLKPFRNIQDYSMFVLIGIIVWTFFSQSLTSAAPSLLDQSALVRRVRFPRETIPAAVVTVQLATFLALIGLVTPVAIGVRGTLRPALLLLPLMLVALYLFALGLGLVVSVLHAHFRDVAPILGAVLLPWFFVTPIFFRTSQAPGVSHRHWLGSLLTWANPVAPFIDAVRSILYAGRVPGAATLIYVLTAALISVVGGLWLFRRLERELAVLL